VVRVAGIGAATVVALLSRGDALVLAVLLGLAAFDLRAAAASALVALAVLARMGTTSLPALAGAQAVLGPAGASNPGLGALSAWLAALALVLVCPGGWTAVPFGMAAALVVNGPAATSFGALVVRVLAMVAFIDLALAAGRWWPKSVTRPAGLVSAGLAVVAGVAAAPPGGVHLTHAIEAASIRDAVALLVAGVIVALVGPPLYQRLRPHLGTIEGVRYSPMHRRQPRGAGREGELQ
jgi:hypothetical protein